MRKTKRKSEAQRYHFALIEVHLDFAVSLDSGLQVEPLVGEPELVLVCERGLLPVLLAFQDQVGFQVERLRRDERLA